MIGLLTAAALLLLAAGLMKIGRPNGAEPALASARLPGADRLSAPMLMRATGLVETLVAATAIGLGGRLGAGLLVVAFVALSAMSIRLISLDGAADCGCFGRPGVLTRWHVAVNLGYAGAALIALGRPSGTIAGELTRHPFTGSALLLGALVLAYLSYLMMTALPELLRLAVPLEVSR
ncbi:MAG: MauE/DoxX family redox-associated membrane protein [Jatrophihabitans sp.]